MPRVAGALFLVLALHGLLCGQDLDFQAQREAVVSLDGLWRFHTGDDPRWADPNFDDHTWPLLRFDKRWGEQGQKDDSDVAWYRLRVRVDEKRPLALLLTRIMSSYQVYANGSLIGAMGTMPPYPEGYGLHVALIPLSKIRAAPTLSIALRVWRDPRFSFFGGGGPTQGGSLLGDSKIVADRYRASRVETAWAQTSDLIIVVLDILAGLTALGLYITGHSELEYLWYALAQLLFGLYLCLMVYWSLTPSPDNLATIAANLDDLAEVFNILFLFRILGRQRTWLFWLALLSPALDFITGELWLHAYVSYEFQSTVITCLASIVCIWILWTAWQAVRRRVPEALLLFGPLLLDSVISLMRFAVNSLFTLKIPVPGTLLLLTKGFDIGMFHLSITILTDLLVLLAALAVLIVRFSRTHREEEQHVRELEEARTVQQVLVPDETPVVPGFSIASVYQPAQQVGGDFFQVIPLTQGVLVALGDVSGKGLPAAMTVSLLVGTLRTLVEQTESPAAILQGLNRRLVGRSSGFTTCLIARLHPDGQGTLANAGHLPPYRNGEEIETLSDLPLGLSLDTRYGESPLALQPNDCLTFVSDGVVEARNTQGELFGFERTRQTSAQPASTIAKTVMQFGQEDDITVVTIKRVEQAAAYIT